MGPGENGADDLPAERRLSARPAQDARERQQADVDAALQAGWTIRFDFMRMEYAATRELHTDRTIGGLLRKIREAGPL